MADATATARAELRKLHRAREPEVLKPLLRDAALDADSRQRVENAGAGDARRASRRPVVGLGQPVPPGISAQHVGGHRPALARRGVPARARPRDRRPADRRQARQCRLALAQGQVALDPGQQRDLGAGDRPRPGQRERAGERPEAPPLPRRRAVRPPGGRRGDAADGRDLRHGPDHRRGDPADGEARECRLHRQLRHARRGGAHLPGRRTLFPRLRGRDPGRRQGRGARAQHLGQALRPPPALRGGAVRTLRALADRAGRGAGGRWPSDRASPSPSTPRRASGSR